MVKKVMVKSYGKKLFIKIRLQILEISRVVDNNEQQTTQSQPSHRPTFSLGM